MRILYDSKDPKHKLPFGTLTEGQTCHISVHIPFSCATREVKLVVLRENKAPYAEFAMTRSGEDGAYEIYAADFTLAADLYFYYFRITTQNERFSLYREGYDQTNMEAGELWQLSFLPRDFHVPERFRGNVMYQIFPDRFHRAGHCNTADKLTPFWLHENLRDVPAYLPDAKGEVQNCDFYGGNLRGIAEKIDYLASLGVGVIYLNPIFKAWSNHRYDTADYHKIDELLGTEQDFTHLCRAAHRRGIKVILDGVFSHTGSNSRYFDKNGVFGGGAYHCPDSPYRSWFEFIEYPHKYTAWWGIETLPCVKELDESFLRFIIEDENSVVAHWLRAGADGFRLDVADELPDAFIAALRRRIKELKPDALLIGEVWEDASNKISYGTRRRYFTGGELDSVMNYPWRTAIIDFVTGKDGGTALVQCVMTVAENYPTEVLPLLMNMLSTHDTPRILSLLSPREMPAAREERAIYRMDGEARELALLRLRAASFLQFVLPGMPCIFYGDEIGTEGYGDPFCRSYFDWDRVKSNPLCDFFVRLGALRKASTTLQGGSVRADCVGEGVVRIVRECEDEVLCAIVNVGKPTALHAAGALSFAERASISEDKLLLDTYGFALLRESKKTGGEA